MLDLLDKNIRPALAQLEQFVKNPVFGQFCAQLKDVYACRESIEFSSCSWEKGWNIKFKKSGKSLCTVYPREFYFTVLVVVGRKEKLPAEAVLPECAPALQQLYRETKEGGGQKWLMIDLEDRDDMYRDVFRLIDIRRNS